VPAAPYRRVLLRELLPRAALRVLQVGLAPFCLGTLRLADRKRAATQIFGFVGFVFCQSILLAKVITLTAVSQLPLEMAEKQGFGTSHGQMNV
jgi:hypothetical protein